MSQGGVGANQRTDRPGPHDPGGARARAPAGRTPHRSRPHLATATQRLADEVAAAARELATHPDAGVGARLQDAEDQAPVVFLSRPETRNHRSSQRRCSRPTSDSPALPRTSRTPTASRTSSGCSSERDLDVARDRLSDAAKEAQKLAGGDVQRRLDEASDQLEQLRDEVPDLGG